MKITCDFKKDPSGTWFDPESEKDVYGTMVCWMGLVNVEYKGKRYRGTGMFPGYHPAYKRAELSEAEKRQLRLQAMRNVRDMVCSKRAARVFGRRMTAFQRW